MLGVRFAQNQKMVGFVMGAPTGLNIRDTLIEAYEVKLMCTLEKYRGKKLLPIIVRQLIKMGVEAKFEYAFFQSIECVAKPVCLVTNYHIDLESISSTFVSRHKFIKGTLRDMTSKDSFQVL